MDKMVKSFLEIKSSKQKKRIVDQILTEVYLPCRRLSTLPSKCLVDQVPTYEKFPPSSGEFVFKGTQAFFSHSRDRLRETVVRKLVILEIDSLESRAFTFRTKVSSGNTDRFARDLFLSLSLVAVNRERLDWIAFTRRGDAERKQKPKRRIRSTTADDD